MGSFLRTHGHRPEVRWDPCRAFWSRLLATGAISPYEHRAGPLEQWVFRGHRPCVRVRTPPRRGSNGVEGPGTHTIFTRPLSRPRSANYGIFGHGWCPLWKRRSTRRIRTSRTLTGDHVTVAREQSTAPQEKAQSGMGPSPEALPEMVFTPPSGWPGLHLRELWEFRDLLYFLAWRDIKVRYKQTVLGVAWAVLQPLLTMVVFSIFFGVLGRMSSEGRRLPRAKLDPGQSLSVPPDIIQRNEAMQANA